MLMTHTESDTQTAFSCCICLLIRRALCHAFAMLFWGCTFFSMQQNPPSKTSQTLKVVFLGFGIKVSTYCKKMFFQSPRGTMYLNNLILWKDHDEIVIFQDWKWLFQHHINRRWLSNCNCVTALFCSVCGKSTLRLLCLTLLIVGVDRRSVSDLNAAVCWRLYSSSDFFST